MSQRFLVTLTAVIALLIGPAVWASAQNAVSPAPEVASKTAPTSVQQEDVIISAMKAELSRSMKNLFLKDYQAPYFISYLIRDRREVSAVAKLGAIFSFEDKKTRPGYVEVRVGSREIDNSKGLKRDYDFDRPPSAWLLDYQFPVDDEANVIRNKLWVLTDLLYKRAMADYLKKKGKLAYKAEEKVKINDFSIEPACEFRGPKAELTLDKDQWLGVLRRVSKTFLEHPELVDSAVEIKATSDTKYLVNSENTIIIEGGTSYVLKATARAWAEDGMLLTHSVRYACRDSAELPSEEKLTADIKKMISELKELRQAEELKPCSVPAIFDSEMSYVLIHEAVGHRLEGERQREEEEGQTFKGKVGERILPNFLSLIDDPTLPQFEDQTLLGYYIYDDQGVPAQKVVLVEDGVLKNYLMSRRPIEDFDNSNGHARLCADTDDFCSRWFGITPMSRMGNLVVQSKKQVSNEALEKQLVEECKKRGLPFGLIFVGSDGGHTSTDQYDYQAFLGKPKLVYKVNATDGSRKLVRGVNIVGTPLNTLEKVLVTGDDYRVFNGYCGAESGTVPTSGIAPSILLSEIEIQKSPEEKERPPLLPPPAFEQTASY